MRTVARLFSALVVCSALAQAQATGEEFKVYTDHPRLFLKAQRLRLLKRERERQSMRWIQFETLAKGVAEMPEPGFSYALYHAVSGDAAAGKRAIEWAAGAGTDTRQIALVYDWCQDLMTPEQSKKIAAKLMAAVQQPRADDIQSVRTRALAAIAVSEQLKDGAESVLRDIVSAWWRQKMAPRIEQGADIAPGPDLFALLELLHAMRDNTVIDLRESARDYFKQLPAFYVTSHYPAPYPAAENEYRIPFYKSAGEPDLNRAAVSRAAGLAMVAYDTNATENQFVQGWVMQDRFLMRGPYGSPYEFLWANPYQPGLSYAHLPLVFHSERSGAVFLRSSWEEDATWFGLFEGQMQVFRDGRITVLRPTDSGTKAGKIVIGDTATVVLARPGTRFQSEGGDVFVVNLKPRRRYEVEVDDEEMTEVETDGVGTLYLPSGKERTPGIKIRERSAT